MKHEVLVVGLGYVGLPIAVRAAEAGHHVVGVDVDQKKIHAINAGTSHVEDVSDERLGNVIAKSLFRAQRVNGIKSPFTMAIITVPTPVDDLKKPDLRYIVHAAEYVALNLEEGATVVLESTTYPGTTEDVVAKVIRDITKMEPGRDYHLGYSPERINPGDTVHTFERIPKLVSGVNEASLHVIQEFYDTLVDTTVPVSSPRAAELAKVFENTFSQVNIALVNELAVVCSELGLDVDEVLDAADTKGHSIMRFRPGPGVGGHCIAVDPLYLTWMRREQQGKPFRFAELADDINGAMPVHVVKRARNLLLARKIKMWNSRIMVLGMAYKPGVADVRESPAVEVIKLLQEAGAEVLALDPHVNAPEDAERAAKDAGLYDLVIVATDHAEFDYSLIREAAVQVLDTRNRYPRDTEKVAKL